MLKYYLLENKLLCLNTHFQKWQRQSWIHKSPNATMSPIYYIIINRKWNSSAKNCRAYNSYVSIASDHHILSANIRLNLRANNKKSSKIKQYDWIRLKIDTETQYNFITKTPQLLYLV